jgi:catechol 2,3-dioxygenase-like lactoylglutathione lyase family enzyme
MSGLLPTTNAYSHVIVPVSDMARSIEWYGRVFGFEVLNRTKIDSEAADEITGLRNVSIDMVRGHVGNALIELVQMDHDDDGDPGGRVHGQVHGLTISVSDVQRCWELAVEHRIDIGAPPVQFGDFHSMLIRDPDGFTYDLTDYRGLNPHTYLGTGGTGDTHETG